MAFEIYESLFRRFRNKQSVEFFIPRHERNVHQRTVFLDDSRAEQLAGIEKIVENFRFFFICLFHRFEAAAAFNPLKHLSADINSVAGRGIEHAVFLCVNGISEHGGRPRQNVVRDEIFPHYNNDRTCRTDIFLRSRENESVFRHIERLRQKTGGHIRD